VDEIYLNNHFGTMTYEKFDVFAPETGSTEDSYRIINNPIVTHYRIINNAIVTHYRIINNAIVTQLTRASNKVDTDGEITFLLPLKKNTT